MDQEIRNKLRNVVTQCRKLLEDAITQELEGKYSIFAKKDQVTADPKAEMKNLTSPEEQAARKDILDHYAHIKARGFKPKDALDQLIREIAFTHLNRLCAYKMMEAREVYVGGQKFREAVSRGVNSNGVKFYLAEHPDEERLFNTGHQDVAYRHFLDWLGGALSDEIGVLFNPNDPANRLYPRQKTLDDVLDLLNDGGIKAEETELRDQWPLIWSQDETIGWVYQYFTPKELRDQARKESQAPRNSYELAFRNQFFTPRYVVEFLTDNTLGRIWYEMRKGDTKLKDQCRYMVRRPTEIFLKDGEQPPKDAAEGKDDLSQEELLKLPIHIPHRPKKDPRELKILDPACGSGHFLLYCFDLLLTIYEEAYADPDLGPALKKDYATLDALKRDVPRLILAHNLHGIDIDLRASQIAALALWLRCQRAYQEMGLKKDRPKITRSNFVCAEPMPGEEQMLKEFVGQLEPKVLGQVVEVVFDKMKLAGEAGSLLKIEEEIRDAIREAKRQYAIGGISIQRTLFDKPTEPVVKVFSVKDITDAQFFEGAESQVIEALRSYAEKAQNGQRLQRRLFSEDAVRGFAFVDLCQKRYDVVLMNPPFGESSSPASQLISKEYPRTKSDLFAAFVERGLVVLHSGGILGAITSRTGFFLSSLQRWREELLLGMANPTAFSDLGYGVLDSALVETAAYCVQKSTARHTGAYFRLLQEDDRPTSLSTTINALNEGNLNKLLFLVKPDNFAVVPGSPFAYWVPASVRNLFQSLPRFESEGRSVKQGLATADDFQFVRAWWEVPVSGLLDPSDSPQKATEVTAFAQWTADRTHHGTEWIAFAKGGDSSGFYPHIHLVVRWRESGQDIKGRLNPKYGRPYSNVWQLAGTERDHFFRPGVTFPRRIRRFGLSVLPSGCIFSDNSCVLFFEDRKEMEATLALYSSLVVRYLLSMLTVTRKFEVGLIRILPFVSDTSLIDVSRSIVRKAWQEQCRDETSRWFVSPLHEGGKSIEGDMTSVDAFAGRAFGINSDEMADMAVVVKAFEQLAEKDEEEDDEEGCSRTTQDDPKAWLSYLVGVTLGRWVPKAEEVLRSTHYLDDIYTPLPATPHAATNSEHSIPVADEALQVVRSVGIVADDPEHEHDIVACIRKHTECVLGELAEARESVLCQSLGSGTLREYFRKPGKGGFWDDHISRYSKSRRKAPIYWLLQSSKKNYAIWLYYHRLDKDLLFKALVNYVEPKIRLEASRLESFRSQKAAAGESGKEARRLAKEVERQEDFLSELRDFEDKLRRAANLHLEPDLNDGVVLNIAPLWELVPWKEAKSYWDELLKGEYEWSSIGKQLRQKGLVK